MHAGTTDKELRHQYSALVGKWYVRVVLVLVERDIVQDLDIERQIVANIVQMELTPTVMIMSI